jgi:hypothetical protein
MDRLAALGTIDIPQLRDPLPMKLGGRRGELDPIVHCFRIKPFNVSHAQAKLTRSSRVVS